MFGNTALVKIKSLNNKKLNKILRQAEAKQERKEDEESARNRQIFIEEVNF